MKRTNMKLAVSAYKDKNYKLALSLYNVLSETISEKFFAYNVRLCEKKLGIPHFIRKMPYPLGKLKIACVMDDFTYHSYKYECKLYQLTPKNILEELNTFQPDLLFIESAWRGKDGLWDRKISTISKELYTGIKWCNEHLIPTLFWNKEDPVHFSTFINTARLFDFVCTTDIDRISHYKIQLKHENIFLLPFACQPKVHNPIERYERKDAFCFAGSYYVRYPERIENLESYIDELPKLKPLEIFDRNFGKDNPNYAFPEKYTPFIVGTLPFEEIDKAYKGYKYSINLNSIKHSQTMFARRVFELLASNSTVISNYSRGVKVFFGNIPFVSDNGRQIYNKIEATSEMQREKVLLAGLRKVMMEHTYRDRLEHITERVLLWPKQNKLPSVLIIAKCDTACQAEWVIDCYRLQNYSSIRLMLLLPSFEQQKIVIPRDADITVVQADKLSGAIEQAHILSSEWVGVFNPDDYYGPNYILDLILATQYTTEQAIAKAEYFIANSSEMVLANSGNSYRINNTFCIERGIIKTDNAALKFFVKKAFNETNTTLQLNNLSIDKFNYCKNISTLNSRSHLEYVSDIDYDCGFTMDYILNKTNEIKQSSKQDVNSDGVKKWDASLLYEHFKKNNFENIKFSLSNNELQIISTLDDDSHEYVYIHKYFSIKEFNTHNGMDSFLDCKYDFGLNYLIIFYDKDKKKLFHNIMLACVNNVNATPENACYFRIGLRILGHGKADIKELLWAHKTYNLDTFLTKNNILLITNNYPEYSNLYKNGFVHSRVKAYRKKDITVDVFRLHPKPLQFHEFEDVEVTTGNEDILRNILLTGLHKRVLVHVMTETLWSVLKDFPDIKIIVWIHGAEIQHWKRRKFNYNSEEDRNKAMLASDRRVKFWTPILASPPSNVHFVFVSEYFVSEISQDYGLSIATNAYSVIHNTINTELYTYTQKEMAQRKKILSIGSYASAKYANDLSVKAIQLLSTKSFFKELEFTLIGDGPLFDKILAPLQNFDNIIIVRTFLRHHEIAKLHREHGVFLCPTRWDSQGVSRGEAMSSGLVPITNAVAAIPEFCDDTCALLAPAEDAQAMADSIERLFYGPALFKKLSFNAAKRVRAQSSEDLMITKEIDLFTKGTHDA